MRLERKGVNIFVDGTVGDAGTLDERRVQKLMGEIATLLALPKDHPRQLSSSAVPIGGGLLISAAVLGYDAHAALHVDVGNATFRLDCFGYQLDQTKVMDLVHIYLSPVGLQLRTVVRDFQQVS